MACVISGILSGIGVTSEAVAGLFWLPGIIFGIAFALVTISHLSKKIIFASSSTAIYFGVIQFSIFSSDLLKDSPYTVFAFSGALGAFMLAVSFVSMNKVERKVKAICIVTILGLIAGAIFYLTMSNFDYFDSPVGFIPSFVIWQVVVGTSLSFMGKMRKQPDKP